MLIYIVGTGGGKMKAKIQKIALYSLPFIFMFLSMIYIYHQLKNEQFLSHDSSTQLKSLTITGHNIPFDPDTDWYEVALSTNETSLAINAEAKDKSATVKIFNNDDLTKHDEVYIYVTSKDHQIGKYTISYDNKTAMKYFNNNIDFCDKITSDYCLKFFKTKDKENILLFSYDYITTGGYPNINYITLNDKILFSKKLTNGVFNNIRIIDDTLLFTYYSEPNKLGLYAITTTGLVSLDKPVMDESFKDLYTYDYIYKNKTIYVKTRIPYKDKKELCKYKNDTLFEARYTIKYNNNIFSTPELTSSLKVSEYKIIKNIYC